MGAKSQRKGRAGELELVALLNGYGIRAEPGKAISYGSTPDITGVPGLHVEVKRNERLNVLEAMRQAVRDAEKFGDGLPAVFHRRNRSEWLVTMKMTDFLGVYKKWQEQNRN